MLRFSPTTPMRMKATHSSCMPLAGCLNQNVSINLVLTSATAIHTAKAVLADPSTYEIIAPDDFGLTREIAIGHRLMGWNSLRQRAETLGLTLDDGTLRSLTRTVKQMADTRALSLHEVDAILHEAARA